MDVKELEKKTVVELKDIAREAGISGISAMKKADLVAAIAGAAPGIEPAAESAPADDDLAAAIAETSPEDQTSPESESTIDELTAAIVETAPEAAPEPESTGEALSAEGEEEKPESSEDKPRLEPVVQAASEPETAAESVSETAPEPESLAEATPEGAPEPTVEEAPSPEAAPAKKAEPAPEPSKPEAVPTRMQVRLRDKHDIPALKIEKKALRSQILAAMADQDYKKLKELRNRKKELRRLLNRAG
jgi:hypothetical protein